MDNKKALAVVGVLGGLATLLFLRKRPATITAAAVIIAVLDESGNEIPHNSPVELEPGGSYTVAVTVTNQSKSKGEPIGADLRTTIEAVVNSTPLMTAAQRTDSYGPDQALVFTWPLNVPFDFPAASGAISAIVLDPNSNQLAAATLPITIAALMRPAIMPLVAGSNIIIYTGKTCDLPQALTNVVDKVDGIWARGDWTNGLWLVYSPDMPPAFWTLHELENGRTYIIAVTEDCTWELP